MARRIKSKSRKHYGNRTFGAGNTKNRRGKGSRGGVGRAGFHKHKRLHYLVTEGPSTTAPGFVNMGKRPIMEIGLNDVSRQIEKGKFKQEAGLYDANLLRKGKFVKLLGNGEFKYKASIKVDSFSKSAKIKVEKAGGKLISAIVE
ncbi:uL15 family ribosomal protein [Candidatus Micrarchaeota archaeon]|nr:uL15 family ribosomal protein [Candidatus Micrarchaeota archaeon]